MERAPGRTAHLPWWVQVLAVHALARVFAAGVLLVVARTQAANPWTPSAPSYLEYTGLMWDGSWYREIAEEGYPAELPRGEDGRVLQNAWAFFPLFPALARGLMELTGGPWQVVAPVLALVLGAAGMLAVHQVVVAALERAGPGAADGDREARVRRWLPLLTVAVLTTSAAAPVLQMAYTESLALLLLATTLWCVLRRHYLLAVPVVLALGLTRAVALPVALVVVVHGLTRLRDPQDRLPGAGDRLRLLLLVLVALASGLLWPAICASVTGEPDAYTQTQGAWRARGEVVPVLPWFDVARWLWGGGGVWVLLGTVALAVVLLMSRSMARLGPELRAWTAGYLGYLLVVVEPGTSLVRFGLLAFPVAGVVALAALRSRWPRTSSVLVLVVGLLAQIAWVALLWRLVPPSGWPP